MTIEIESKTTIDNTNPKNETKTDDPTEKIDTTLLSRAITALLKHHTHLQNDNTKKSQKLNLLATDDDSTPLSLIISLFRTPPPNETSHRPRRLTIPHPLRTLSTHPSLCLICKGDAETKPFLQSLISQFPSELSCVKKVLTLDSLRKKYPTFEDKRTLCHDYDLFLCDERILPMVGKALGREFYRKKKLPVPISVTKGEGKGLPVEVGQCVDATYVTVNRGTTCLNIRVGHTTMPPSHITANILAILPELVKKIPQGGFNNIRSMSLQLTNSISLPFFHRSPEELAAIEKMAGLSKTQQENLSEMTKEDEQKKKEELLEKKRKMMRMKDSPLVKALKKQKMDESSKDVVDTKDTVQDEKDDSTVVKDKDATSTKKKSKKRSQQNTTPLATASSKKKKKKHEDKKEETVDDAVATTPPKETEEKEETPTMTPKVTTDESDTIEPSTTSSKSSKKKKKKKKRSLSTDDTAEMEKEEKDDTPKEVVDDVAEQGSLPETPAGPTKEMMEPSTLKKARTKSDMVTTPTVVKEDSITLTETPEANTKVTKSSKKSTRKKAKKAKDDQVKDKEETPLVIMETDEETPKTPLQITTPKDEETTTTTPTATEATTKPPSSKSSKQKKKSKKKKRSSSMGDVKELTDGDDDKETAKEEDGDVVTDSPLPESSTSVNKSTRKSVQKTPAKIIEEPTTPTGDKSETPAMATKSKRKSCRKKTKAKEVTIENDDAADNVAPLWTTLPSTKKKKSKKSNDDDKEMTTAAVATPARKADEMPVTDTPLRRSTRKRK